MGGGGGGGIGRILLNYSNFNVKKLLDNYCNDVSMPAGPLPKIFIFEALLLLFLHFL